MPKRRSVQGRRNHKLKGLTQQEAHSRTVSAWRTKHQRYKYGHFVASEPNEGEHIVGYDQLIQEAQESLSKGQDPIHNPAVQAELKALPFKARFAALAHIRAAQIKAQRDQEREKRNRGTQVKEGSEHPAYDASTAAGRAEHKALTAKEILMAETAKDPAKAREELETVLRAELKKKTTPVKGITADEWLEMRKRRKAGDKIIHQIGAELERRHQQQYEEQAKQAGIDWATAPVGAQARAESPQGPDYYDKAARERINKLTGKLGIHLLGEDAKSDNQEFQNLFKIVDRHVPKVNILPMDPRTARKAAHDRLMGPVSRVEDPQKRRELAREAAQIRKEVVQMAYNPSYGAQTADVGQKTRRMILNDRISKFAQKLGQSINKEESDAEFAALMKGITQSGDFGEFHYLLGLPDAASQLGRRDSMQAAGRTAEEVYKESGHEAITGPKGWKAQHEFIKGQLRNSAKSLQEGGFYKGWDASGKVVREDQAVFGVKANKHWRYETDKGVQTIEFSDTRKSTKDAIKGEIIREHLVKTFNKGIHTRLGERRIRGLKENQEYQDLKKKVGSPGATVEEKARYQELHKRAQSKTWGEYEKGQVDQIAGVVPSFTIGGKKFGDRLLFGNLQDSSDFSEKAGTLLSGPARARRRREAQEALYQEANRALARGDIPDFVRYARGNGEFTPISRLDPMEGGQFKSRAQLRTELGQGRGAELTGRDIARHRYRVDTNIDVSQRSQPRIILNMGKDPIETGGTTGVHNIELSHGVKAAEYTEGINDPRGIRIADPEEAKRIIEGKNALLVRREKQYAEVGRKAHKYVNEEQDKIKSSPQWRNTTNEAQRLKLLDVARLRAYGKASDEVAREHYKEEKISNGSAKALEFRNELFGVAQQAAENDVQDSHLKELAAAGIAATYFGANRKIRKNVVPRAINTVVNSMHGIPVIGGLMKKYEIYDLADVEEGFRPLGETFGDWKYRIGHPISSPDGVAGITNISEFRLRDKFISKPKKHARMLEDMRHRLERVDRNKQRIWEKRQEGPLKGLDKRLADTVERHQDYKALDFHLGIGALPRFRHGGRDLNIDSTINERLSGFAQEHLHMFIGTRADRAMHPKLRAIEVARRTMIQFPETAPEHQAAKGLMASISSIIRREQKRAGVSSHTIDLPGGGVWSHILKPEERVGFPLHPSQVVKPGNELVHRASFWKAGEAFGSHPPAMPNWFGRNKGFLLGAGIIGALLGAHYIRHRIVEGRKPEEERVAYYNKFLPPPFKVALPHVQATRHSRIPRNVFTQEFMLADKRVPTGIKIGLKDRRFAPRPMDWVDVTGEKMPSNLPIGFPVPWKKKGMGGGSIIDSFTFHQDAPFKRAYSPSTHSIYVGGKRLPLRINIGNKQVVKLRTRNPNALDQKAREDLVWAFAGTPKEADVRAFFSTGTIDQKLIDMFDDPDVVNKIKTKKYSEEPSAKRLERREKAAIAAADRDVIGKTVEDREADRTARARDKEDRNPDSSRMRGHFAYGAGFQTGEGIFD